MAAQGPSLQLYIGETKKPLHGCMVQHWTTNSRQNLAGHLHLKDRGHSYENRNGHILATEEKPA